jgi:hypothetical protein
VASVRATVAACGAGDGVTEVSQCTLLAVGSSAGSIGALCFVMALGSCFGVREGLGGVDGSR